MPLAQLGRVTYALLKPLQTLSGGFTSCAGRAAYHSGMSSTQWAWRVWHTEILVSREFKRVRQIEPQVVVFFAESDFAGSVFVDAVWILPHVSSYIGVNTGIGTGLLADWRNKVSFSYQLFSNAVQMLNDSGTGRARVEAMGDCIPGQGDAVSSTFVVKMEKELFCHTRAYNNSACDTGSELLRRGRNLRPHMMRLRPTTRPLPRFCSSVGRV